MKSTVLVNDLHFGVQRTAGTTPQTAAALREYLLSSFESLIEQHTDKNLCANGDLFDTFNVPLSDVLAVYQILRGWLNAGEGLLILGMGNHDLAKISANLSSFNLLGQILLAQFPDRVQVVTEPAMVLPGVYQIPHVSNQDIFNLAIEQVPADTRMLLVHANYDNAFAVEADHSLNFSAEQAKALLKRLPDLRIVFGHEHQARTALGGRLIVTGNQWPSSISDCLHNPHDMKHAHLIKGDSLELGSIPTWCAGTSYFEAGWDDLIGLAGDSAQFVRVVGDATTEQAGDVVKAIADFRKKSTAFVITNAVSIEGVTEMTDAVVNMEAVQSFDVLGYLYENLDPPQVEMVKSVLAGEEQMKEAA